MNVMRKNSFNRLKCLVGGFSSPWRVTEANRAARRMHSSLKWSDDDQRRFYQMKSSALAHGDQPKKS
jgi:hypothetical protein